ncbi:MAG: Ig-like domain-containing protein [Oscillospiraceae bacterium]|nr:Ig-like domain-containing protein [Oscillospiraceae bacterium]
MTYGNTTHARKRRFLALCMALALAVGLAAPLARAADYACSEMHVGAIFKPGDMITYTSGYTITYRHYLTDGKLDNSDSPQQNPEESQSSYSMGESGALPSLDDVGSTAYFWKVTSNDNIGGVALRAFAGSVVSFDPNGGRLETGEGVMPSQGVKAGETAALSGNSYSHETLFFTGWNTAADGSGTAYADRASIGPLTADQTLYAQWGEAVSLDKTSMTLAVGETGTLSATVLESVVGADTTGEWQSDNDAVATVSQSGVVTAVAPGETKITVFYSDYYAECTVTVRAALNLNATSLPLTEGETFTLSTTITPTPETQPTIRWQSSNPNVATVNQSGVVTAVAEGEATIVASTGEGNNRMTAGCTVTVRQRPSLSLDKTELALEVGAGYTLSASVTPTPETQPTIRWQSSNTNVATVNQSGVVTAVAEGEATITASTGEGSSLLTAQCAVTVRQKPSLSLDKTELALKVGAGYTLSASVTPTPETQPTIRWQSSNPNVATVSESGVVTAVAAGEATITASTGEGSSLLTAQCAVTVESVRVTGVTISQSEYGLLVGAQATLSARVTPDNAENQAILWSTDDSSIASVAPSSDTANGESYAVITGVAPGKVKIIATSNDGSFTAVCLVTVSSDPSSRSIDITQSTATVAAGNTVTLTANVQPNGTPVTWSSSDESVATVSQSGVVTGVAPGRAIITATITGTELFASCPVTVTDGTVEPAVLASGFCGDGVTWMLTDGGELIFKLTSDTANASGVISDFAPGSTPWYRYRASIRSVKLDAGVRHIGSYAFYACGALREVFVESSVSVGSRAFAYCAALERVTGGPHADGALFTSLGDGAFYATFRLNPTLRPTAETTSSNAFELSGIDVH